MILFSPTIHPMFHSYTSPRYLTGKATCGGVVPLHFQLRDTRGRAIAPEVDRNGTKTPRKLNIHGAFWRDKPITKLDWLKNPSFGLCFAPLSQIQKMQQFHLLHLFCLYLHDQTRFRLCSPDCNLSLSKLIWLLCHLLEASTLWCADILQHPAPLGGGKETFDSPISILIMMYQVLKYPSAIIHTAPRQGGSKIWQALFFPGSRGVGCSKMFFYSTV